MLSPGRRVKQFCLLAGALMLLLSHAFAQDARVDVQLSTNKVNLDEFFTIRVLATGISAELDISELEKDFTIRKRGSNSQLSIVNGKSTRLVEWVLEALPKRSGILIIPPVFVGDVQSPPQSIQVLESAAGAQRELFLTGAVDNAEPYVQSQIIYSLRVYQDVTLLDGSLSEMTMDSVNVTQLGGDRNFQEQLDGRTYTVLERRFALFPQRSGEIEVPSVILQATVAVDPNRVPNARTRTKRVVRRTEPVTLNVLPRPDGLAGQWWLPAKRVQLTQEWSEPLDTLTVDQPVTRTIRLLADGVGDAQLPEIQVPQIDGLSIYADSPESTTEAATNSVLSEQRVSWAVIPQKAGSHSFPELRINWFNTTTGKAEVAVLPEQTLLVGSAQPSSVVGAPGNTSAGLTADTNSNTATNELLPHNTQQASDGNALVPAPDTEQNASNMLEAGTDSTAVANIGVQNALPVSGSGSSIWKPVALAVSAGWLLSLIGLYWWWRRSSVDKNVVEPAVPDNNLWHRRASSKEAMSMVRTACDSGSPDKVARALEAWGQTVWPASPPANLTALAQRLDHAPLTSCLRKLDASRFGKLASPFELAEFPALLSDAVNTQAQQRAPVSAGLNALPSL